MLLSCVVHTNKRIKRNVKTLQTKSVIIFLDNMEHLIMKGCVKNNFYPRFHMLKGALG